MFAITPIYKDDLLCFHGDAIRVEDSCSSSHKKDVILDSEPIGLMDGEEYSKVWGGRCVDDTDICDEWKSGQ